MRMTDPASIYIVGKSNSGKTTLVLKLIKELKQRGFSVAAIKHGHHAGEFDSPGKDSWRMAEAGATAVGFISSKRTFMQIKTEKETALHDLMKNFHGFDVVIIEGYKTADVPKIEIVRKDNGGKLICPPSELLAIISDQYFQESVPQFGIEDIRTLSDFLVEKLCLEQKSDR